MKEKHYGCATKSSERTCKSISHYSKILGVGDYFLDLLNPGDSKPCDRLRWAERQVCSRVMWLLDKRVLGRNPDSKYRNLEQTSCRSIARGCQRHQHLNLMFLTMQTCSYLAKRIHFKVQYPRFQLPESLLSLQLSSQELVPIKFIEGQAMNCSGINVKMIQD